MKVALASPAWLDLARGTLSELVQREGTAGVTTSMCEVFVAAPDGSVGMCEPGRAAWHFRIDGTTCHVDTGETDDVDLKVVFDYQSAVPFARAVITPDADEVTGPTVLDLQGDPTRMPRYLTDLHNALAEHTA